MRLRIHLVLTVLIVLPFLVLSATLFAATVDPHDLPNTLLTLSVDQVHYLLLMCTCLILLFEFTDQVLNRQRVRALLIHPPPRTPRFAAVGKIFWWLLAIPLMLFGVIIPMFDLIGSMPFSLSNSTTELVAKVALLLLTSVFVYHLLDRSLNERNVLAEIVGQTGRVSVLDREADHAYMESMLDTISPGSDVLVTHFEEPVSSMKTEGTFGYHYESDFMRKWYATIREKQLRVTQVVLINSQQDIMDLEARLSLVSDIPTYSLAYLVAPPLTMFVDFMVVPSEFALIGFSDERAMRNMNVFGVLLSKGPAVQRFEQVFRDILLSEATFVKTFEGPRPEAIRRLRDETASIARASSRELRRLYGFVDTVSESKEI